MLSYELSNAEIVEAIKISRGDTVYPEDITVIKSFGRPTYVIDRGCQFTYLCRKTNKGIITIKKINWWED